MQSLEHLAQNAGIFFFSGIWQGFALAAAVGLCLRLVPKATASLRFAIWTAVLMVVAALPFASTAYRGYTGHTTGVSPLHLNVWWSFAIAIVWVAASLFRAANLAAHGVRLWQLRKRTLPVSASVANEYAALLKSRRQRVELCTSDEIDRPSVIGFFVPRILIPTWLFTQLTTAELEQIVLHEMEHLRRGDDWLNLLQKVSVVLFPLNPIILWVERRLCFERELACDDGVLRRTKAPRAYATCLASLAERGLDHRAVSLALGVFGNVMRQSELTQRVHRILRRETALSPMCARAFTGVVALGLLGSAAGLARCPQIISFAGPIQPLAVEGGQSQAALGVPIVPAASDHSTLHGVTEQVVFRGQEAPHMTLLKATVEQSQPRVLKKPTAHAVRRTTPAVEKILAARQILASAEEQQSRDAEKWVVLSSWTSIHPQMMVPVVDSDSDADDDTVLFPYAAVPTDGGWLLLQL